jgi:hypothetical protein
MSMQPALADRGGARQPACARPGPSACASSAANGPRFAQRESDEPELPEGLDDGDDSGDEPELPEGLDDGDDSGDEPELPAGLDDGDDSGDEPELPEGLGDSADRDASAGEDDSDTLQEILNLVGFTELRGGFRVQEDPFEKRATLGEIRTEITIEKFFLNRYTIKVSADFLVDAVDTDRDYELDGEWRFLDVREAFFAFSPVWFADIKIGRQILTWGTGDMVFLNDLFPKDWHATLLGRDVAYLKAPSDAIKLGLFTKLANLDLVYVPRFNSDRFITGERVSYYNPILGERAGSNAIQDPERPDEWFKDYEFHARLSRNIGSAEIAVYTYRGFWKSPAGIDPMTLRSVFPELSVHGGSIRNPLGSGVAVLEGAYYDSREDREGDNPWISNSEMRFLAGYERQLPELAADLTISVQYYLELMVNYSEYRAMNPPIVPLKDELRHVITARLHKLLLDQNLELSLFGYYSPSDEDGYLRPRIAYKLDDHWQASAGANVFLGREDHTFFNQFAKNSNLYAALRYSF